MAVHETALAFQWLYATLAGDATLASYAPGGVWRGLAPPATLTPYVVVSFQAGTDVISMNAYRLLDDLLYQVKAVGPASITPTLINAASQIDALLKLASGTVTSGAILSCYRQSPFELDQLVNGELWTDWGGLYRVIIQQV